jgi:folate-dependent phosphoribosylglycinamide formyltransferase PurN
VSDVRPLLSLPAQQRPRCAVFLSGSGTNAEKLIELHRSLGAEASFDLSCLVTDRPLQSRARDIASAAGIPLVEHDIGAFYLARGLSSTSLATEAGRKVRDEWTAELKTKLLPLAPDFGVFAGFVPLTNLTASLPCLNVHPGDLSVSNDKGERLYIGLHTLPIEIAVLAGEESLRSTVILASAYAATGAGMDEGLILGLSPEVDIDQQGRDAAAWNAIAAKRPAKKPKGGWGDDLEKMAELNQDKLKRHGDWLVLPRCVQDFAAGRFGVDAAGKLYLRRGPDAWLPIDCIAYSKTGREVLFRS